MSSKKNVNAFIYRSEKKADHYLYLSEPIETQNNTLPKALLDLLGDLTFTFELPIDSSTKLAAADTQHVLNELNEKGFYLQVPPTGYIHPCDQQAVMDAKQEAGLLN